MVMFGSGMPGESLPTTRLTYFGRDKPVEKITGPLSDNLNPWRASAFVVLGKRLLP